MLSDLSHKYNETELSILILSAATASKHGKEENKSYVFYLVRKRKELWAQSMN